MMDIQAVNIFEMYSSNNLKFGFYVRHYSWSEELIATVKGIDGVEEGKQIEGEPPYFHRHYPEDHWLAGSIWPRTVVLEGDWIQGGTMNTSRGGYDEWLKIDTSNL